MHAIDTREVCTCRRGDHYRKGLGLRLCTSSLTNMISYHMHLLKVLDFPLLSETRSRGSVGSQDVII